LYHVGPILDRKKSVKALKAKQVILPIIQPFGRRIWGDYSRFGIIPENTRGYSGKENRGKKFLQFGNTCTYNLTRDLDKGVGL